MSLRLVCDVADISVNALVAAVCSSLHMGDIAIHTLDVSEIIHAKVERSSHLRIEEGTDSTHDGELLILLLGICRCMEE